MRLQTIGPGIGHVGYIDSQSFACCVIDIFRLPVMPKVVSRSAVSSSTDGEPAPLTLYESS